MSKTPKEGTEEIDFFQLDFSDDPTPDPEVITDPIEDPIEEPIEEPEADPIEEPIEEITEPVEEDEVIKANFEFLKTQGALFLPEDYEFVATPEGFEKAVADSAENFRKEAVSEMFEAMPQEGRDLLQYYLNGGTDVQSFIELYSEVDPARLDMENEEHQEWAVRELLRQTTKFSDAKINKTLESYKDDMRLKEEAEEAAQELLKIRDERRKAFIEEEKKREEQLRAQAAQARTDLYNTLSTVTDINGIPYSKEDAKKAVADLYQPVKLTDGSVTTMFNYRLQQTLSDPKKIALLNKLMENDFKMDFVARKKTSEAAKQLHQKLKETQKFRGMPPQRGTGQFDPSRAKLDFN